MRLLLKNQWYGVKNLNPQAVGNEFINIKKNWDDLNNGASTFSNLTVTGDITNITPGAGLILTTPDGLHTARIAISNVVGGVISITTQQLT